MDCGVEWVVFSMNLRAEGTQVIGMEGLTPVPRGRALPRWFPDPSRDLNTADISSAGLVLEFRIQK